jgi:hypothetical protein
MFDSETFETCLFDLRSHSLAASTGLARMEIDTQEPMHTTKASSACLSLTFVGMVIMITSGGVLVFWLAYRQGSSLGLFALRALRPPIGEPLPDRWQAPEQCIIPNYRFNGSNEPGVGFAANYHIESTYRASGIAAGLLKTDQYVRFSQSWIQILVTEFCETHPTSRFCVSGDDDLVVWTAEVPNVESRIVPDSFTGQRTQSPLSFNASIGKPVFGCTSTKRLMVAAQGSLVLSIPHIQKRFFLPCENSSKRECKLGLYRCRSDSKKNCFPMVFEIDSDFVLDEHSELTIGNANSLPLVAFTDSSQVNGGADGGFIVRNNWGAVGHSLEYLLGRRSSDIDRRICANRR